MPSTILSALHVLICLILINYHLSKVCSFIHYSLNKCLLTTYHALGTILGTRGHLSEQNRYKFLLSGTKHTKTEKLAQGHKSSSWDSNPRSLVPEFLFITPVFC